MKLHTRRAHRIREEVPLGPLLRSLGYLVQDGGPEQQFACDLHGGQDRRPSARFYPNQNNTYCWACHKLRGPLEYVMEKKGLRFREALEFLETTHNLPPLVEEEEDPNEDPHYGEAPPQDSLKLIDKLLSQLTSDQADMGQVLRWWEEYDRLIYFEGDGSDLLQEIRQWMGYAMPSSQIDTWAV